jgi:hypothetical protein
MAEQEIPPQLAMFRLATGYYYSCAIYAVVRLRIADLMATGLRHFEALAHETGCNAPALRRVLRLLITAGVFTEDDAGTFSLTALGDCLREGVPGSMRSAALLWGGETQKSWIDLEKCIRTGEPVSADPFARIESDPEFAANFDQAMAEFTRQTAIAVAAAYDFSQIHVLVDIGGGNGALLAGILQANPHMRGVLFDRPPVIARAKPPDRCEAVAGDFFESVPSGGDAYIIKHVIHDWNDEKAEAILKSCRRAMRPYARLLLVEGLYPARIDTSDGSRGAASNDVNMLVATGGRQRTENEFRSLFTASGFELTRIIPTKARVFVLEGGLSG